MVKPHKKAIEYDLVDRQNNIISSGDASKAARLNLFTRSVHIILVNKRGNLLVCKRPASKKIYPSQISSSAGGHVEKGETYLEAAKRELKEELGISTPLQDVGEFLVVNKVERAIHRLYIGRAKKVFPDKNEVESLYFMSLSNLKKDIRIHPGRYADPFHSALSCYAGRKKRVYILDFDHTLFNWYKFKNDLKKNFQKRLHISPKLFDESKNNSEANGRLYNFKTHIRELSKISGVSYGKLEKESRNIARKLPSYIFEDARKFLTELKRKKAKVFILTYGDPTNQKMFIKLTKVHNCCNKAISVVSKDLKKRWMKKYLKNKNIVFVNDDPNETVMIMKGLPITSKYVIVERPTAKFYPIPKTKTYFVVRNLMEIFDLYL